MTASLPKPPDAATDWTIPQDWAGYSESEHRVWDRLFARQIGMLPRADSVADRAMISAFNAVTRMRHRLTK